MGTPVHVTDHAEQAVARLADVFRVGTSVPALVRVMTRPIQDLEDAAWQVRLARSIDGGSGAQLDVIGRIVGQQREGRTDDIYRLWLRARVLLNRGSGTGDDILGIFAAVMQGSTTLQLEEQYPAGLVLRIGSAAVIDPAAASEILQLAKMAGVRAILESATTIDTTSFAFDDNGAGFGDDTTPSAGGTFASAL